MQLNWGLGAITIYSVISGAPLPAAESTSISIAAGEVPLEIAAYGSSDFPAQTAEMTVTLTSRGATAAEADAASIALADKVRQSLIAEGVKATDLIVRQAVGLGRFGFVGNEAFDPDDLPPALARLQTSNANSPKSASTYIDVTVRDLSKLPDIRKAMLALNATLVSGPVLKLVDQDKAREAAIARAVDNARREADSYAAALHMRVVRIGSVKNSASNEAYFGTDMLQRLAAANSGLIPANNMVTTDARVTIEFVLAK